jgi:hypothetical protein
MPPIVGIGGQIGQAVGAKVDLVPDSALRPDLRGRVLGRAAAW